jgi:hypothetical protein
MTPLVACHFDKLRTMRFAAAGTDNRVAIGKAGGRCGKIPQLDLRLLSVRTEGSSAKRSGEDSSRATSDYFLNQLDYSCNPTCEKLPGRWQGDPAVFEEPRERARSLTSARRRADF